MAITKLDFPTASTPSYTPTLATDYNNQNEIIERNARGYNAISLTNWDATTTKPQIDAGSVIEINGSTYDITTDTDIDTSGASSGTIYVYFDDGTPEFKFLDTAPTWSATLNGWYTSGDRFTGHYMTWDGASSYTIKREYGNEKNSGGGYSVGASGILVSEGYSLTGLGKNDSLVITSDATPLFFKEGFIQVATHELSAGSITLFNINCYYDGGDYSLIAQTGTITVPAVFDSVISFISNGSNS